MRVVCSLLCVASFLAGSALAQSPITLTVNTLSPGQAIPDDYSGASFGMSSLKPGTNGYFFDSNNLQVLTLFHELGFKYLRICGDGPAPTTGNVDALFRFAAAAGVKVCYSMRLKNGDASQDASMAAYVRANYRPYLDAFAIGNEPNAYDGQDPDITNYASFHAKWTSFAATILGSVPDAKFGGPDGGTSTEGASWGTQFAADEAGSGIVTSIFFHYYVGGSCFGKTPQQLIDEMLSPAWITNNLPTKYAATGAPVLSLGLPYRFTEANSYCTGGNLGVPGGNNCFATALFALDDLYWWTGYQCRGLCFHNTMWRYNATFYQDDNGDYHVYPIGYGIKAFDLGGHGNVEPMSISNPDGLNFTAYAVEDATNFYVTIINKEHGTNARSAAATIVLDGVASGDVSAMFLLAPNNDPAATNGVTLGGAPITNSGPWQGQWTDLGPLTNGQCALTVPVTSAAIVRIQTQMPPLVVRDLPAQVTLIAGRSYLYSPEVKGSAPLGYQWYLDGNPVAGATNSIYPLTAGTAGGTATCAVVITNTYGTVTSRVSTVTVISPLTDFYGVQVQGQGPAGYWPLQETNAPAGATVETNYGTLGQLGNACYAMTRPGDVLFDQGGALTGSGDNDPSVQFVGANGNPTNSITNFNSYAFVPRLSPALTLQPPLTLECWIKDNVNNGSFGDLIGEGGNGLNCPDNSGNRGGIRLSYGGNKSGGPNLQVYTYTGSGNTRDSAGTPANSLPRGTWHHCAATYDGSTVVMYIDGTEQGSFPATMALDTWSPLTIGQGLWYGNRPRRAFSGLEDEVAIYTNALSAADIANHYRAGITPGSNYAQTVLADKPLLYYRMNAAGYINPPAELSPRAVNYGSAPAQGFYLPGTTPGAASGPAIPALGSKSAAASFNGVFGCVDAGCDPAFNPTGTQPFTAMVWFRTYPSDNGVGALMSHGADSSWSIHLDGSNGRIVFSTGAAGSVDSTNILNDGKWHCVAGVHEGSGNALYVDGAFNNSNAATGRMVGDGSNDLLLGGDPQYSQVGAGGRYFAGVLAQAAYYTNALTGPEILEIYQAGTNAPPPDTLELAWPGSNQLRLNWNYGTLESATNVGGPYHVVPWAYPPYPIVPANAQQFYRLKEN